MIDFPPSSAVPAVVGGVLIGAAAGSLALGAGKIMGCSGIVGGTLHDLLQRAAAQTWRVWFMAGVLLSGLAWVLLGQHVPGSHNALPAAWIIPAGLLTGFGTRLGSGCTSGHGVCGIPRLAMRSLLAVGLFMGSGAVTVFVTRHLLG